MIRQSAETIMSLQAHVPAVIEAIALICDCIESGGKVLTAGNGGSAAEALHMAEELLGRYKTNRRSLPSVALCGDGTVLTCIGNDFGFDEIFSRQIDGLGMPGDALIIFSTSGSARNLETAVESAARKGLKTICLLGRDGGRLAGKGDIEIIIGGGATERIQEAHQALVHIVLEGVEERFQARG